MNLFVTLPSTFFEYFGAMNELDKAIVMNSEII